MMIDTKLKSAHHWDLVFQGTGWKIMFSRTRGVVVEGDVDNDELMTASASVNLSVLTLFLIQSVVVDKKQGAVAAPEESSAVQPEEREPLAWFYRDNLGRPCSTTRKPTSPLKDLQPLYP